MAYVRGSTYTLLPTAPAAPHAFSMFATNPQGSHETFAALLQVLRPREDSATGKGFADAVWRFFGVS